MSSNPMNRFVKSVGIRTEDRADGSMTYLIAVHVEQSLEAAKAVRDYISSLVTTPDETTARQCLAEGCTDSASPFCVAHRHWPAETPNSVERELARYKQALTRANGFLIMHDLEPVKLEYSPEEPRETTPGHCIDCIELKNALAAAVKVANEARECHDRDQDMRTMKLLIALSGHLPKWRADTDRIHDVLRRAVEHLSAPLPPEEPKALTPSQIGRAIADNCELAPLPHPPGCECRLCAPEKASEDLPACECLVRNKAHSAYHNVKCPRYVADLL